MERTRSLDIHIMLSVAWEIVLLGSPILSALPIIKKNIYADSFSSLPFSYYDFLKMTVVEVYAGGSKISPPTEKVGMNG
ncbi:very-long-chain (3R)-3-hydroxyacyl-CoA dehydratase [Trifolium repens]|nr:very-long-chain (3R)-3-hydroxyacyl-CoA dehydratase [Trifolium repens]